jgi:hypothetical protein
MRDYDLGPSLGGGYRDALAYALSLEPGGIALEFGVASGTTLRMIAEKMPAYGFDSFEGLPEDWRAGFPAGMFACAVPDVPGATIIPGLFEDTLQEWYPPRRIGLLHIDCDLYSSTTTVLHYVGPFMWHGCIVVFDEWHGYPGCEDHEQKAWREYTEEFGTSWEVLGHGPEQWVIRITGTHR